MNPKNYEIDKIEPQTQTADEVTEWMAGCLLLMKADMQTHQENVRSQVWQSLIERRPTVISLRF